jgi:hypothetical protein
MSTPRIDLHPGVHDPVVLMISRRQVEDADLQSVIHGLRPFTATRKCVFHAIPDTVPL